MVNYGFDHHFIGVTAGFYFGVCGAAVLGAGIDSGGHYGFGSDPSGSGVCEPPNFIERR